MKFSDCASEYFLNAINRCGTELFQYSQCLETDAYRRPGMCRGAQAAYDHCAFAKMGIDKVIDFSNRQYKVCSPKLPPHFD